MNLKQISPSGVFTAVDETPEHTALRMAQERDAAVAEMVAMKKRHIEEMARATDALKQTTKSRNQLSRKVQELQRENEKLKKRVNDSSADAVAAAESRAKTYADDLIAFNQDIRRQERTHKKEKETLGKQLKMLQERNGDLRGQVADLRNRLSTVERAQVNNRLYSQIRALRSRLNNVLATSDLPVDQTILPGREQQLKDAVNEVDPIEDSEPDPSKGFLEID